MTLRSRFAFAWAAEKLTAAPKSYASFVNGVLARSAAPDHVAAAHLVGVRRSKTTFPQVTASRDRSRERDRVDARTRLAVSRHAKAPLRERVSGPIWAECQLSDLSRLRWPEC